MVHSNASYLSKPKARSRAEGHFFLSSNKADPIDNGAVLNIAALIKAVMSSAVEAELGALYINAREAVPQCCTLEEMGHKQPPTPMQTNNTTAVGVVNNNIQPKCTKAMDMRFHWLRCHETQNQFYFSGTPDPPTKQTTRPSITAQHTTWKAPQNPHPQECTWRPLHLPKTYTNSSHAPKMNTNSIPSCSNRCINNIHKSHSRGTERVC